MPVLAIINAKGGSGKSTVATSISAYAAKAGIKLMLGDLDPQQSVRTWLRLRDPGLPAVSGWLLDEGRVFRPPAGVTHAILDTPSGLNGYHLARVVMASHLIIVPVAASAFDRDAAEECIGNLRLLPRVISGLCVVACMGMRIPRRSPAEKITQAWAEKIGVKFLGVVRYSPAYPALVDKGSSVFDDAGKNEVSLRSDWKPLLEWLHAFYFDSPNERDALRETHKILDVWPRRMPNLVSFQAKALVLPLPAAVFASVPVYAPVVLPPYSLAMSRAPETAMASELSYAVVVTAVVKAVEAAESSVDLVVPAQASDLVVRDGPPDIDPPDQPVSGILANVSRGFKRLLG